MAKEFKQLLGTRVYLEVPMKEDGSVILDKKTQEEITKEQAKKLSKLKVYAVGAGITSELLKEGDHVLLDPYTVKNGSMIPLSDKKEVLMISYHDIIHIW